VGSATDGAGYGVRKKLDRASILRLPGRCVAFQPVIKPAALTASRIWAPANVLPRGRLDYEVAVDVVAWLSRNEPQDDKQVAPKAKGIARLPDT
jgi:hypothetical protein